MKIPEILWQLLLEKEFTCFLTTNLAPAYNVSATDATTRALSEIEQNAVRYTAGYVIKKLEERYSKRKSKEAKDCTKALQAMAGKLHTRTNKTSEEASSEAKEQPSSNKWINMVNRGGLYFVEDIVYDLFVTIEPIVDSKLSEILKEHGKGIEQVKKENLAWVCDDEEVQDLWDQISSNSIEDEEISEDLLREIVHMWVTTRGHSKTHKIKEDYKLSQKTTVKGKRSLRKELDS